RSPRVFYLFFLMIRLPLRFTLFPYTTLFRSGIFTGRVSRIVRLLVPTTTRRETLYPSRAINTRSCAQTQEQAVVRGSSPFEIIGDRKSTRLNSSHVAISYAVFCLKKKKKN